MIYPKFDVAEMHNNNKQNKISKRGDEEGDQKYNLIKKNLFFMRRGVNKWTLLGCPSAPADQQP